MQNIDKGWPVGIQQFWKSIDRIGEIGEESGFYQETGRLELCRCFNKQLDNTILKEKDHIKVLVIRKNELKQESYDIISKLTSLQKLVLESVGSKILDFDVSELKQLTSVTIASASNTELPGWVLQLKGLTELNISNTRIEKFSDIEGYMGYRNWEKLDISYTAIDKLPEFKGQKLDRLRELRVANTGLEKIPDSYFTSALRLLDCSNTQINALIHMKKARNLQMFCCSHNDHLKNLNGLHMDNLKVLDVSHCMNLHKLPRKCKYQALEVMAVCGDILDTLPPNLIKHCIEKNIRFKEENKKKIEMLNCDQGELSEISDEMRGVYLEGIFLKQMDFRYLVDNDSKFLNYYIKEERKGSLHPKHETRIMFLGKNQAAADLFFKQMFPEYPKIYYMNYGGLKVLDTIGGELDDVLRRLDSDADISMWLMLEGINEWFMHHILFNDHDLFIVILNERDSISNQNKAIQWLKEIEQCVRYATIGFVVIGSRGMDTAVISLKEIKRVCRRMYFRFLKVFYLKTEEADSCDGLIGWLVDGIKDKTNYAMEILPEWKILRGEIVNYLNLRRIINQTRFESLVMFQERYGKNAFISYLIESKSLFHIRYSGKEDYYFKTEWVISALFELLDIFRKGGWKNAFMIDDLRQYLQNDSIVYLDFFQDVESLGYLMNIFEELGIVCKYESRYYNLFSSARISIESEYYKRTQENVEITYQAEFEMLTEQMTMKIISVLMKYWLDRQKTIDSVEIYEGYAILKELNADDGGGAIVINAVTGQSGKLIFYLLAAGKKTKKAKDAALKKLTEQAVILLKKLNDSTYFPLWSSEIYIHYTDNGLDDFISVKEVENYFKSGYASAFMAKYNMIINIEDIYSKYWN